MMKSSLMIAVLAMTAGAVFAADARRPGPVPTDYAPELRAVPATAKTETTLVAYWDFQDPQHPFLGDPQGWYGIDNTYRDPVWHVDDYACDDLGAAPGPGNHCAWAGEVFAYDCGGTFEGYGNDYDERLLWSGIPADPGAATDVRITGYVHTDTESGYDYLYLEWHDVATWEVIDLGATLSGGLTGVHDNLYFDVTQTVPAGRDVHLRLRARSDGAWSDQDCQVNPFQSTRGHSMIDEISVYFDQGGGDALQSYEDFEGGSLGAWDTETAPYVGDFAEVWNFLGDVDGCGSNTTPQFAFIDYGQIPGVGPSTSVEWNYGPNGYVVNSTGGVYGDPGVITLSNFIWSPVIELPEDMNGHELRFTVYEHMDFLGMAGMFWIWEVDSSTDGVDWGGWSIDFFVQYGGPNYERVDVDVSALMRPGARYARVRLGVVHWPQFGAYLDATPAPYFDDVSWHSYRFDKPVLTYREYELAEDAYPAALDWSDLDAADVPFDMARDIVGTGGPDLVHGDSVVVTVASVRAGASLSRPPRLHYQVRTNPVFDAYRNSGVPYAGHVDGAPVMVDAQHYLDRWSFELPDVDFLYPGDILHYYFSAEDTLAGGADPQSATLPASLDGFGIYPGDSGHQPLLWPTDFTVNALPSVQSATPGHVPEILFWNDFGDRGGQGEWMTALAALHMVQGWDYDVYTTNEPSGGVGNGLGAAATPALVQLYDHLLYTSGDLARFTLTGPKVWDAGVGEWVSDGSDDIALITDFVEDGGNFFGTGDSFLYDVATEPSGTGLAMTSGVFGITTFTDDVRLLIDGQMLPVVSAVLGNPVLPYGGRDFLAAGACPERRRFDAVQAVTASTVSSVAEFLGPYGEIDAYVFDAMVANARPDVGKTLVSAVDYSVWHTLHDGPDKLNAPPAMRSVILCDVLRWFTGNPGVCEPWDPWASTDVPAAARLDAVNRPNPFNPLTTIRLTLPADGRVGLKVYSLRGELVRTLLDEVRPAGVHAVDWDGRDDAGRALASGVYFYEVRAGGESVVGKTALVK